MKKRVCLVGAMFVGLFALIGCHRSFESRAERVIDLIDCKLDLTDEQVKAANLIKDKVIALHNEKREDKTKHIAEFKELLSKDRIEKSDVAKMIERKRGHVDELIPQVMPDILDFHASLSKEQKEKLVKLVDKFAKKHSRWH